MAFVRYPFFNSLLNQRVLGFKSIGGLYSKETHAPPKQIVIRNQNRFFTRSFVTSSYFPKGKITGLSAYLPVVESLLERASEEIDSSSLEHTVVFYVHHALQTSVNVLDGILRLGAKPENIFVLGKVYSDCDSVIKNVKNLGVNYRPCSIQRGVGKFEQHFIYDVNLIWREISNKLESGSKNILVLDHGGHAIDYCPEELTKYPIIGIEKTMAGFIDIEKKGLPFFPIIGVANCAAKKILESPFIAQATLSRLPEIKKINDTRPICGVVGYGAIGKAITEKLLSLGHTVIVCDQAVKNSEKKANLFTVNHLTSVISSADYIFGCTGSDIFKDKSALELVRYTSKETVFISCSSEDKEFLSLVRKLRNKKPSKFVVNPLDDLCYTNESHKKIRILKGGFPINFDHSGESVSSNDIQLTRALVLASVLQAIKLFKHKNFGRMSGKIIKLDPKLQKIIVHEWLKYQITGRFSDEIIAQFGKESWIRKHSGGDYGCAFFSASSLKSKGDKCLGEAVLPKLNVS